MRNQDHLSYIKALYTLKEFPDTSIDFDAIRRAIKNHGKSASYEQCLSRKQNLKIKELNDAISSLRQLGDKGYRDSLSLSKSLTEKTRLYKKALELDFNTKIQMVIKEIEVENKSIYEEAVRYIQSKNIEEVQHGIDLLNKLNPDYLDVSERIKYATRKVKKSKSKKVSFYFSIACILIAAVFGVFYIKNVYIPKQTYENACASMNSAEYDSAIEAFSKLGDYKDSSDKLIEAKYLKAVNLLAAEDFSNANIIFNELGNYKDSEIKKEETEKGILYKRSVDLFSVKKYKDAYSGFLSIKDYKDSSEYLEQMIVLPIKITLDSHSVSFKETITIDYDNNSLQMKPVTYKNEHYEFDDQGRLLIHSNASSTIKFNYEENGNISSTRWGEPIYYDQYGNELEDERQTDDFHNITGSNINTYDSNLEGVLLEVEHSYGSGASTYTSFTYDVFLNNGDTDIQKTVWTNIRLMFGYAIWH